MKLRCALLTVLLAAAAMSQGSEAASSPNNRRMLTFGLGLQHHRAWWAGWLQHHKVRRGEWPDNAHRCCSCSTTPRAHTLLSAAATRLCVSHTHALWVPWRGEVTVQLRSAMRLA